MSTSYLKTDDIREEDLAAGGGVPTSRQVISGNGLTGGGTLAADRTLAVGAGDGISVAADAVAVDATVVRTTRTISTSAPLTGGGDLTSNRTLSIDAATPSSAGSMSAVDKGKINLIYTGAGSPEGAVTAAVGSIYLRTDGGGVTTLYVKESGAGNTGWVAK